MKNEMHSVNGQKDKTLLFGILGIVFCWFVFGIIFGILGLVNYLKGKKMNLENTGKRKAGFILSILSIVFAILVIIGAAVSSGNTEEKPADVKQEAVEAFTEVKEDVDEAEAVEEETEVTVNSIIALYKGDTAAGAEINDSNDGVEVTAFYSDDTSEVVDGWTIENPGTLEAGQTSTFTVTYEGVSTEMSVGCSTQDHDAYVAECTPVEYEDLARTPDDYSFTNVSMKGEVMQVQEDSEQTLYLVQVTYNGYFYDDIVMVLIDNGNLETRILEDDIVNIYGVSMGLTTYETVLGAESTVPVIYAEFVDFVE